MNVSLCASRDNARNMNEIKFDNEFFRFRFAKFETWRAFLIHPDAGFIMEFIVCNIIGNKSQRKQQANTQSDGIFKENVLDWAES